MIFLMQVRLRMVSVNLARGNSLSEIPDGMDYQVNLLLKFDCQIDFEIGHHNLNFFVFRIHPLLAKSPSQAGLLWK